MIILESEVKKNLRKNKIKIDQLCVSAWLKVYSTNICSVMFIPTGKLKELEKEILSEVTWSENDKHHTNSFLAPTFKSSDVSTYLK